ncbi:cadherin-like protein 26 [Brachionichthys hirsutus]|uniref:cadherin-like protein 26 n=1 Tax=Brachionichthys hirsutus TaxID=412623 RepID=UPI0036050619
MAKIHRCFFIILCLGLHGSSLKISQRQKRNWIIDSFSISEGYTGSFPYSLGTIHVEKNLGMFEILGQGAGEEPKGVLQIDGHTGEITVHRPVDYEKFRSLKVILQAYNRENHLIETRLGIEILIIDGNDNPPKFDRETYEISIKESTPQGTDLIVIKANDADSTENNRMFDMKIVSVTPKIQDVEFFVKHISRTDTGTISFKGCMDHEKAEKYTVIVEAKDHGKEMQLSSSCTVIINVEDGNDHLPEITGQIGPGHVKEGEDHVLVLRLQVTDRDKRGTAAWRAKYRIQGDDDNNFRITTDPETNEGRLYVEKHLDYEVSQQKSVTVMVENEIPYHSCKVVSRRATGLWEIVSTSSTTGTERSYASSQRVTVTVEDVNEPPIFDQANKHVTLSENIKEGQDLVTFTAKDPDISSANTVVYMKGEDPADWVTVDHVTGKMTTSKALDRESHFVKDNVYNVTIYAVDNGQPPMSGTATLSIHVVDVNDNAPALSMSSIVMCQSDGASLANVTAFDLDEEPYGGPFHFKLLGDVEGKWRVDPNQGYSANLVKENAVHSGHSKLILEVSDLQDKTASHNLSVTVCKCFDPAKPNCNSPKGSSVRGGALGVIFFSIFLFAALLLLAALLSTKADKAALSDEGSGQHLMNSNIETPGMDCKVGMMSSNQGHSQNGKHNRRRSDVSTIQLKPNRTTGAAAASQAYSAYGVSQNEQQRGNYSYQHWRHNAMDHGFSRGNSMRQSMGSSSFNVRRAYLDGNSEHRRWMGRNNYSAEQMREIHLKLLNTMLHNLQAPGVELGDHAPRVYAEEGYTEGSYDLDAISIPDVPFDRDLDLNYKFRTLASICTPSERTAFSVMTSAPAEIHRSQL